MSPECVSEIILPLKNGSLSCLCTLPGFIWSRMYMYSHTSHQMASRYYVFKVATCYFLFLLVSCGCQGPLIPLFNEQRLACFCCCLSAVAALTRGDTQVWVPGLIAAAGLIVFLCSTLIDSPDSGGIPSGTQRQTNLGGQSIADGRVSAQHSVWLRFPRNVCVYVKQCELAGVFADCPHSAGANWNLQSVPKCLFMCFWLWASEFTTAAN